MQDFHSKSVSFFDLSVLFVARWAEGLGTAFAVLGMAAANFPTALYASGEGRMGTLGHLAGHRLNACHSVYSVPRTIHGVRSNSECSPPLDIEGFQRLIAADFRTILERATLSDLGAWRSVPRDRGLWQALGMAKKRTKEDKLRRNIERLEKPERTLERDRRELAAEQLKALAASAASDST